MSRGRLPFLLPVAILVVASGCVMADQSGQALPHEVYQHGKGQLGELSFHFRASINYVSVVARLGLFAGTLLLFRRAWKSQQQRPVLAGLVLVCVASGWFVLSGATKVWAYKIAVSDAGLQIHIPFEVDIDEPWTQVYGVTVAGKEWREGFDALYTEWSTMQVMLSGGRHINVDLQELGVVQRSIFMKALQHRSKMTAVERGPFDSQL